MSGEATVDPDGTTTFSSDEEVPPTFDANETGGGPTGEEGAAGTEGAEEIIEEAVKGTDPAIYLILGVLVIAVIYFVFFRRKKSEGEDDFFSSLDTEKFNLKLPTEVDEYLTIKEKCLEAGWDPSVRPPGPAAQSNGPHRVLAQALMKRAIADIPIVTHIQKESAGMNRLYAQSMCSVGQWRAFQAAEQLVSGEVEDVRAEADTIEPGWSQVIWRQAMQYHQMLKDKHEHESKQQEMAAKKIKEKQQTKAKLSPEDEKKKAEEQAEKAATELIKQEEREKSSKKAFSSSGGGALKKGFLESSNKTNSKKK